MFIFFSKEHVQICQQYCVSYYQGGDVKVFHDLDEKFEDCKQKLSLFLEYFEMLETTSDFPKLLLSCFKNRILSLNENFKNLQEQFHVCDNCLHLKPNLVKKKNF